MNFNNGSPHSSHDANKECSRRVASHCKSKWHRNRFYPPCCLGTFAIIVGVHCIDVVLPEQSHQLTRPGADIQRSRKEDRSVNKTNGIESRKRSGRKDLPVTRYDGSSGSGPWRTNTERVKAGEPSNAKSCQCMPLPKLSISRLHIPQNNPITSDVAQQARRYSKRPPSAVPRMRGAGRDPESRGPGFGNGPPDSGALGGGKGGRDQRLGRTWQLAAGGNILAVRRRARVQ